MIRASSSSSSNEIAASHNRTEFGIISKPRRRTTLSSFDVVPFGPLSREEARNHKLTDLGSLRSACAAIPRPSSGG